MTKKKAKICGVTNRAAVDAAVQGGADFIGFVFFPPSPRHVTPQVAAELSKALPTHVKTVAVLVDVSNEELTQILAHFRPDFLQLHGHESKERVKELREISGIAVMKAISVRSSDDIANGATYSDVADMLLFDAKAPSTSPLPGGNGISFDWTLLKTRQFSVPWMLSGGLNIENVRQAMRISGATMVDVSSAVESEPGVKDEGLVKLFLEKVKAT